MAEREIEPPEPQVSALTIGPSFLLPVALPYTDIACSPSHSGINYASISRYIDIAASTSGDWAALAIVVSLR